MAKDDRPEKCAFNFEREERILELPDVLLRQSMHNAAENELNFAKITLSGAWCLDRKSMV
ncbi:MAG: hypothetical protein U0M33_04610 [Lachnospiraceae bacterium]|nr:hypothetical protein [Lachnospiraceae bacterium]